MRFVLGNRLLDRAGGTEVHLLTLARHLEQLGHEAIVYSPVLGPFTDHVLSQGVRAVGTLQELPGDCDVVLSQDALVVYDLADRFPDAPDAAHPGAAGRACLADRTRPASGGARR